MMVKGRHAHVSSALVLLAALAGGCGSDGNGGGGTTAGGNTNGTNGTPDGGGCVEEEVVRTLIPITEEDAQNAIKAPHTVHVYDENGTIGDPSTAVIQPSPQTEQGTGIFRATLCKGTHYTLHVVGSDEADPPTYDQILDSPPNNGEQFLRISTVMLSGVAGSLANFEDMPDRAAVSGRVYVTPGGRGNPRQDTVGCARLFLDGNETHFDENTDQRYVAESGLPATPEMQDQTPSLGSFYFGNMTPGKHNLRVEVDGETVAEHDFEVSLVRQDVDSGFILYQIGIDVDLPTNPGC